MQFDAEVHKGVLALPAAVGTAFEGPAPLALEVKPTDSVVAPGDYTTATRLR